MIKLTYKSLLTSKNFPRINKLLSLSSSVLTRRQTISAITHSKKSISNQAVQSTIPKDQQNEIIDHIYYKLSKLIPTRFYLSSSNSDSIRLLYKPNDFYKSLLQNILLAKDRIFLTSLYLGKHEHELIQTLDTALTKNPNLRVYFLLDGLRSTREFPADSSITLISSLISKYGSERIHFRLYRTPAFHGWKSHLIPKRFNEGLGLQHMKFYGFDNDKIILSGANLSHDYFTNRQDRYWLFQNNELNNYYFQILQLVGSLSYKVEMNTNSRKNPCLPCLIWPKNNLTVDPLKDRNQFLRDSSLIITKFLCDRANIEQKNMTKDWDTVIFPISQFTPLFRHSLLDKSTELPTILSLFNIMKNHNLKNHSNINWCFTAGYFNIFPSIRKNMLESNCTNSNVITASSKANGFYESKGVSKYLPHAYLHLTYKFLKQVKSSNSHIFVKEWENGIHNKLNGWSYHAKGIWFYFGNTQNNIYEPFLTVLGSSNYTRRSYSLDLESNIVILTKNDFLKNELRKELNHLLKDTKDVTLNNFKNDPEKHVKRGVKIVTKLLGNRL